MIPNKSTCNEFIPLFSQQNKNCKKRVHYNEKNQLITFCMMQAIAKSQTVYNF